MYDFIQRFAFKSLPIKGAFVNLTDVWQTIQKQKEYDSQIMKVIGELIVANVLLTSSIKFDGKVIVQLQDNPNVDLVVSECTNDMKIRATAKNWQVAEYANYLNIGRLVISIDSNKDGKMYQSIVAMAGNKSVSDALNNYMVQSEQLKTVFVLVATEKKLIGFMLQEMPDRGGSFLDDVKRVFMLAQTLRNQELLENDITSILYKLFHEDDILLFEPLAVEFSCTCGPDRVINMLHGLGYSEVSSIFLEQKEIRITCDFCNSVYIYQEDDVARIFNNLSLDMDSVSKEVH